MNNVNVMSRGSSFRELDDKVLPAAVSMMAWSPKMDLLSVATIQGEIILYRLSWQKVWTLEAPAEGVKVSSLVWRPDGKALAIGYTNSTLIVCDTEDKEILISHVLKDAVQLLQWMSVSENYLMDELEKVVFKDDADDFLPSLQPLNKGFSDTVIGSSRERFAGEGSKDSKKLECQSSLNLLICVTQSGFIYFYAFGIFLCLEYNFKLDPSSNDVPKFRSASISNDYSILTVVYENSEKNLQMISYHLPIFTTRKYELHILAAKQVILTSHFNYLASTIRSITESWEEILVEIDAKLAKYAAEKKRSGCETVSDDFLELLMFGNPTKELEKFLLHDLGEKGLKKLGHSIELTYSNIQKLVLKHVQPVGLAIYYHLVDLCGMAMCSDRFLQFGLTQERCENCLREAGSFMLKATEVQQVIDYSMINFKAFFRWLYGAILRLSDEPIPSEIAKTSEQDLNIVAQFLKDHFSLVPTGAEDERFCFNLERVGQYLKNDDLTTVQEQTNNPWVRFLECHPNLKNDPILFPYKAEKSLVQQHETLQKEFEETRQQIAQHSGQSLAPSFVISLPIKQENPVGKVLHIFDSSKSHLVIYSTDIFPCNHFTFFFLQASYDPYLSNSAFQPFKAVQIYFEESSSCDSNRFYKIQDFQFYNDDMISVLLVKDGNNVVPILAQVPVKAILERAESYNHPPPSAESLSQTNGWNCVVSGGGTSYRLTGVLAHSIEVSGTRHVACITFVSKRRVRLLEMDVEDEEDEEESGNPPEEMDNATNSSKDSSNSFPGLDCSERMEESDENKENFRETSLND